MFHRLLSITTITIMFALLGGHCRNCAAQADDVVTTSMAKKRKAIPEWAALKKSLGAFASRKDSKLAFQTCFSYCLWTMRTLE